MTKKWLTAGLAIIFFVSGAAATTISNEDILIDLENNTVVANLHIEDLTTDSFNYQTSHEVRELMAHFNGEEKDCSIQNLAVGTTINCDTDLKKDFKVKLEYQTDKLVSTQNNIQTFTYSQSIYRPIRNYSLRVLLPEGSGLVDQSNITTPVTQPSGAEVDNLGGRRFSVEWNTNPELGETARFQVIFESFEQEQNSSFLPAILALIILASIAVVVYRRKNKVNASSILEELDSDQEMIVEMLRENEGEMLQKDIVNQSEYSKAKISGVVKDLEEMEIISKEKEGRSNKVVLKNKFLT